MFQRLGSRSWNAGCNGRGVLDAAVRPWVSRLVRLGYLAKGLIYSLMGILALRVAFGLRGGRLTDPSGVLRTLLGQPFGRAMLALIGIGIVCYAAYYIFEALADLRRRGGGVRGWTDRSLTIIKAAVYGVIGVQALRVVLFDERPSDRTEATRGRRDAVSARRVAADGDWHRRDHLRLHATANGLARRRRR